MKSKVCFLFVLIAIIASFVHSDLVPFQSCMQGGAFVPKSLDLTPIKPKPGDTLVVSVMGTVVSPISGGSLAVTVSYQNIPLFQNKYDICKVVSGGCVVQPGTKVVKIEQPILSFAFAGTYNATAKGTDLSGNPLACINFSFTVV
ncbi:hypothetical protein ABK040_011190 [Willaertia magna]